MPRPIVPKTIQITVPKIALTWPHIYLCFIKPNNATEPAISNGIIYVGPKAAKPIGMPIVAPSKSINKPQGFPSFIKDIAVTIINKIKNVNAIRLIGRPP